MAYKNLTASGAATITATRVSKVRITVNAALTGTITVTDGGTTVATITNPTVGNAFEYYDLGSVTVNPSTTCDITVNTDSSHQGK